MSAIEVKPYAQLTVLVEEASLRISDLPKVSHWQKELSTLKKRLEKEEHTVAVFGAFSAGKSSLLNALLEQQALAVSPNPTTAAVTHLYADRTMDEGSAVVYAKSKEQMWEDLSQAFSVIRQKPATFEEAIKLANSLKMADFSAHSRKAVSFLLAAAKGYEKMGGRLGTTFSIGASDVRTYTALEQYACYVQRVDIVHNTDFLSGGFVLVDTPGVDSIHKRHTDVAFEYMRKADAVVFVLYYTHAFSRADKEFLLQLAGVQDVAGADKLFVVINAVDLAKSDEERIAVRNRVEEELRQVGIRKPRVFEVSSQLSFAASILKAQPQDEQFERLVRLRLHLSENDPIPPLETLLRMSGIPDFTVSLQNFIKEQSDTLLNESVLRSFRAISQQVEDECNRLKLLLNQDEARISEMKQSYLSLANDWRKLSEKFKNGLSREESSLKKDWEELVFHAGERMRFRFSSLFREAFNPGLFRGGKDVKGQLNEAAKDFVQSIERLIEIEVRTFSLRVDQGIVRMREQLRESMKKLADELGVPMIHYELEQAADLQHEQSREGTIRASIPLESIASGFKYFSSAKQFFEEDGVSKMINAIEENVLLHVREELGRLTSEASETAVLTMRVSVSHELVAAAESALSDNSIQNSTDSKNTLLAFENAKEWFENHVNRGTLHFS